MKIVMSLSGGMDSSTMLGHLLHQGHAIKCVHFQYGSKHNPYELESAIAVANYYHTELTVINMEEAFKNISSNLMMEGGDIPEGHYEDDNMSKTVVPGRNTIFASVLMGIAESSDCQAIALGTHLGDHAIYSDCRVEYIKALDTLVYLASDKKVSVIAPFQNIDKIGICAEGIRIMTPYQLTRTCYKAQEKSCGKCGACQERIEAFEKNDAHDFIEYE